MCCELSVENMVKKLEIHAFKLLYPNKPRRFPSKPARFSSDYLRSTTYVSSILKNNIKLTFF